MGGEKRRTRVPRLVLAALGPAAVWFLYFLILYPLAVAACQSGVGFPMHIATLAGVTGIAISGWAGWRHWRWRADTSAWETAPPDGPEDSGPAELERTRFLAIVSIVSAAFFMLIVIGQWISTLIFPACLG